MSVIVYVFKEGELYRERTTIPTRWEYPDMPIQEFNKLILLAGVEVNGKRGWFWQDPQGRVYEVDALPDKLKAWHLLLT